ncbi:hypothetical protein PAXINDRAFT_85124, partial [Paxillus involutus ATCC 200175]
FEQAPGEAEAQLALMNKDGVINAVMTDDSDAFVFGAPTVLRNSSLNSDDSIRLYTADAIKDRVCKSLHGEAFALFALCCGGDYDKGLRGCGNGTALGLVRCGLGTGLCRAYTRSRDVADALRCWRQELANHLAHDPTKMIGRLHPSLAASLPDAFPPLNLVELYLHPVITHVNNLAISGDPQPPDTPALAAVMQELLGWEDTAKMLETFCSTIWPAVVLKEILLDLARNSPGGNEASLFQYSL